MFSADLSSNVILLDNDLNKICDKAVLLSHRGPSYEESVLIIVAFVKSRSSINFLQIVNNIYKDLLQRDVINLYNINAVPYVAPLKMDFKYCDPDHVVFNRARLDYLHQGKPYSRQVEESGVVIELNQQELKRLPITVMVLISPLTPQLDWILYYVKELQHLYENIFFCCLIKGVDRTNFSAVLQRCSSARQLNFVYEPLNCKVVDQVMGRNVFVSQIIDMYPIDSYEQISQKQPRVLATDLSVDMLHQNLIDLIQSAVVLNAQEEFRANIKANSDNIYKTQLYCQEDKVYRMGLIK